MPPGAALHQAAPALYRGEPGAPAGGARHRPALDLRQDPECAAGTRLCPAGEPALRAGGPRPHGHRLPVRVLQPLRPVQLHRGAGGPAGRHRQGGARVARGAGGVLARLLGRGGRDPRAHHHRGDRCARPGSGPAFLPGRRRGRARSAQMPVLCRRPAGAQARPRRRVHRLFQLPGMRLHPPAHRQPGGRRGPGRSAPARRAPRDRRGGDAAQGTLRVLRAGRRRQGQAEAEALLAAQVDGTRGGHAGAGAGVARAAARCRPAPDDRQDDRRRSRPLRPLSAP